MEKNMSQIISVEEMLDALYEKAVRGLSCCKCFVDILSSLANCV